MSMPQDCPIQKPRRRQSKRTGLEAQVVRECLLFLKQHPRVVYVERRNTGAVQFQDGGFIRFGQKGAADIWCLVETYRHDHNCQHGVSNGHPMCCPEDWGLACDGCCSVIHVEIECKRSDNKGRQSAVQKQFQEFCDNHRIPYILTTSAQELARCLEYLIFCDQLGNCT